MPVENWIKFCQGFPPQIPHKGVCPQKVQWNFPANSLINGQGHELRSSNSFQWWTPNWGRPKPYNHDMLWLEAGWECGAVLIDKIIAVNRLCMEIIWKMCNMKQMLTFSMGCSKQFSLALAPRNLKRVVATTAADHWVCGSIQWQLPLPHFRKGVREGKERNGEGQV